MGGSLSFATGAESLSEPGSECILSTPLEGVAASRFLEGVGRYLRGDKTTGRREASFDTTDRNGDECVHQRYSLCGDEWHLCVFKIDKARSQVQISFFPGENARDQGIAPFTGCINVLSEPTRIEFWCEYKKVRTGGKVLKAALDELLSRLGATVDTECNVPSLIDSGKLSVISGPIASKSVDAESFLDRYRAVLVDDMCVVELPDGTLVEERSSGSLGLWGSAYYSRHIIDKGACCAHCQEFMEDETMNDMVSIVHLRVHRDPFRLEMWRDHLPGRRAGKGRLRIRRPEFEIERFVRGALKASG